MTQQTTAERLLAIIGMNYRIIQHGEIRIADHSKAAEMIAAEIDSLTAGRDFERSVSTALKDQYSLLAAERNALTAQLAEAREVSKRYEDRYFAVQAVIATLMANDRVYTLCASLMDDGELRTLNEFLCDTKADAEAQP